MQRILFAALWTVSVSVATELDPATPLQTHTPSNIEPQPVQRNTKEGQEVPNPQRLTQHPGAAQPQQPYPGGGGFQPIDYISSPLIGPQQYQDVRREQPLEGLYGKPGMPSGRYLNLPDDEVESFLPGSPVRYLMYQPRTQRYQVVNNVRYAEEPAAEVAVEYLPVQVIPSGLPQYRYPEAPAQPQPAEPNPRSPTSARQQESPQFQGPAYLENLPFPALHQLGPVYSYPAQPVIRILRYAPQHPQYSPL